MGAFYPGLGVIPMGDRDTSRASDAAVPKQATVTWE